MSSNRKTFHILEDECSCIEFLHYSHKLQNETITRIIQHAMADQRKSLAGRPAKNAIYRPITDICRVENLATAKTHHRTRKYRTGRKIVLMNRAVYWVQFDRCNNVEAGLLKTQTESAGPRKEIDCQWSAHRFSPQVTFADTAIRIAPRMEQIKNQGNAA